MFSVTWEVDMIYDDDVRIFGPNHDSPRLQLKSLIGIGVLLKLGHVAKINYLFVMNYLCKMCLIYMVYMKMILVLKILAAG